MKRGLLFALVGGLVVAAHAPASIAPRRTEFHPYREMVPPQEYVASAAGGPGVVLAENIKSRVIVEFTEGGPCGSPGPVVEPRPPRTSDPDSDSRAAWITIGAVGGVFVVLAVVGTVLFRRPRV